MLRVCRSCWWPSLVLVPVVAATPLLGRPGTRDSRERELVSCLGRLGRGAAAASIYRPGVAKITLDIGKTLETRNVSSVVGCTYYFLAAKGHGLAATAEL